MQQESVGGSMKFDGRCRRYHGLTRSSFTAPIIPHRIINNGLFWQQKQRKCKMEVSHKWKPEQNRSNSGQVANRAFFLTRAKAALPHDCKAEQKLSRSSSKIAKQSRKLQGSCNTHTHTQTHTHTHTHTHPSKQQQIVSPSSRWHRCCHP